MCDTYVLTQGRLNEAERFRERILDAMREAVEGDLGECAPYPMVIAAMAVASDFAGAVGMSEDQAVALFRRLYQDARERRLKALS